MQVTEIRKLAKRKPFRAFTVRLTNGAEYEFKEPEDFGAPRNYRSIFHFSDDDWVLIDTDSITAIIER